MSFSQRLVLWLHVAFVIFTIGPVTLAIMSTPRYIRRRDVRILRYLTRMTFVLGAASLAVLIAGFALASMLGKEGNWWVIVSATLFIVAVLLLGLIHRDQRHAIRALEAADADTGARAHHTADKPADGERTDAEAEAAAGGQADEPAATQVAGAGEASAAHLATVERGRIAMIGGVVSLIWLVILVLMVWNS
jgi:uncharacterized membrane protein